MNHTISLPELEDWIQDYAETPGGGNPISIHKWEDFPPNANYHEFYWYFELAMNYMLDPEGLAKSNQDILHLFYDVRNGKVFENAFEVNFGIALENFEYEFFERIRSWL